LDVPFKVPKAGELVAQRLRARILRGELKQGENLPLESEMLDMFQISRPTLREALRILESEGLISISRGTRGGAVVHLPEVRVASRYFGFLLQAKQVTYDDVFSTLSFIEPMAVRWLAEQRTDLAPLRATLDMVRGAVNDNLAYSVAISRFHHKLVELTGVQTMLLLLEMITNIVESYYATVSTTAAKAMDNSQSKRSGYKARERLVELIENGKAAEAEKYWRRHLQRTHQIMLRWQPPDQVVDFSEIL
jgi:DNA-binding FadR family transcriptional regulator